MLFKHIILSATLLVSILIVKTNSFAQATIGADPDSILTGFQKMPQVLLVGSFHFSYPGLDAHKTDEEKKINIFSEKRQKEVEELVDYIAKFKPTMIAVEAGRNTGYLMRRYERWKAGTKPMKANEIDQITFRLIDRLGLDTLYGTDAYSTIYDMQNGSDSTFFLQYFNKIYNTDSEVNDPIRDQYFKWYDYMDGLTLNSTLLEYFHYLNSPKVLDRGYGAYLTGDFKEEDNKGTDILSLYWYNRNLRIFRNIQKLNASPDDRIMILFGAGHMQILNHLFRCSPEFDVVQFSDLQSMP